MNAPTTDYRSVPRVADIYVNDRWVGSVRSEDGAWTAVVSLPHVDVRADFYSREQAERFVAFVGSAAEPLTEALRQFKGSSRGKTYGWAGNGK